MKEGSAGENFGCPLRRGRKRQFADTYLNINLTPTPHHHHHSSPPLPFSPLAILNRVDTIDQSNGLCHKIPHPPHNTVNYNHSSPSIFNLPLLQTLVITRKCGVWFWEELRFHYWQPTQLYGHLSSSIWVPPIQMLLQTPSVSPEHTEEKALIRIIITEADWALTVVNVILILTVINNNTVKQHSSVSVCVCAYQSLSLFSIMLAFWLVLVHYGFLCRALHWNHGIHIFLNMYNTFYERFSWNYLIQTVTTNINRVVMFKLLNHLYC